MRPSNGRPPRRPRLELTIRGSGSRSRTAPRRAHSCPEAELPASAQRPTSHERPVHVTAEVACRTRRPGRWARATAMSRNATSNATVGRPISSRRPPVGAGTPPFLDQPAGPRPLARLAQDRQRRFRVVAPAADHREGRHRVDDLGLGILLEAVRHLQRLGRRPLRVAEGAGNHPLLGEQGEDPGPVEARLVRRGVRGTLEGRRGPGRVAGASRKRPSRASSPRAPAARGSLCECRQAASA